MLAGKPYKGKRLLTYATREGLVEESTNESSTAIKTQFHHACTQFSAQQGTVLSIYIYKVLSTTMRTLGQNEIQAAAPTLILK